MYPKVINNDIDSITSYRTKATSFEVHQIKEIYKVLIEYEKTHNAQESLAYFIEYLKDKSLSYDKMINRLNDNKQVLNKALLNIDITKYRTDHKIFRSRIESLVEKGFENIEIKKPTCCNFGKKLAELEDEPFAKDSKFLEIKKVHNRIHAKLEEYVNADETNRGIHMNEVYKDIDKLFGIVEDLQNDHKYE